LAFLRPEAAMRSLIRASATVQALMDSDVTVAPVEDVPREASLPFITYRRINGSTQHHMGGVSSSGLWMGTTEIIMYADTQAAAWALADAVRGVLDGKDSGTVTVGSDSATFERCHLSNEDTDVFDPRDDSDERVHTVRQEYEWSIRP
jgi:hypothetical protein